MLEQGEILTLEDDKEYVVVSSVVLDNINYVYMIEANNFANVMFCKYDNVDGLYEVDDPDLIKELIKMFNIQLNGSNDLTQEQMTEKLKEYAEILKKESNSQE